MYTLPKRAKLVNKLCGAGELQTAENTEAIAKCGTILKKMVEATESILGANDCLTTIP